MAFRFYHQPDAMDCGPTCLKMVAKHYGRNISLSKLKALSETTREGTSLDKISATAERIGFHTLGIKLSFDQFSKEAPLPCIAHWQNNHFVVVYKINKKKVYIADPAYGLSSYSHSDFIRHWVGEGADENSAGIALLLEPTPKLKEEEKDDKEKGNSFSFLLHYVSRYEKYLLQLSIGLFAGSLIQLIFPFLTQSIVDIGIRNKDINFIWLILLAQVFFFIGRVSITTIRGWILLHLSTRINISFVSDFFIKLMKLPIAFFDAKMTGDLLQRINDHKRIEQLLTNTSLNTLFSFFNLLVFGIVLAWYNAYIFLIFLGGSLLYMGWILLFLTRRRELDYRMFSQQSDEQSKVIELINGMQEIKLHNAERKKRWGWEKIQAKLFKIRTSNLSLEQTQTVGSQVVNEFKNIFITVFAAKLVIDGQLTLGMLMAISYITGQLNAPIQQLINFIYTYQDAKVSLERLMEIHNMENEEKEDVVSLDDLYLNSGIKDILIEDITFRYKGSYENVIQGMSLRIPARKTTAIVGASGSGKTTLLKLLLKFYKPETGEIRIGNVPLNNLGFSRWRALCGTVMQEGFIFNDTVAGNIAVCEEDIDKKRLLQAVEIANIKSFIEELPQGYNTPIGSEGKSISTGQKQRILIARAVYKNPEIMFFDEATSALDANNEKTIMQNLFEFFEQKTVFIIAHRLSTVKHADKIVVLGRGRVIEQGAHDQLVNKRGSYFELVKNQLDLERINA